MFYRKGQGLPSHHFIKTFDSWLFWWMSDKKLGRQKKFFFAEEEDDKWRKISMEAEIKSPLTLKKWLSRICLKATSKARDKRRKGWVWEWNKVPFFCCGCIRVCARVFVCGCVSIRQIKREEEREKKECRNLGRKRGLVAEAKKCQS